MRTVRTLAQLVKFEHTIFALPFAYAGMVLGARQASESITLKLILFITLAMVGARTLAMGLNRLIDAQIDARNPRTAGREIPAGKIKKSSVWLMCAVSLVLLIAATTQLAAITQKLWPIPVLMFVIYPYTKRFTLLCHFFLGASIGLAPLGAWLAAGGSGELLAPYLLWLSIGLWIAGFDIIYAADDVEFDRAHGIHSVPAKLGLRTAFYLVHVSHLTTVIAAASVGYLLGLSLIFWIGLVVTAGLLLWENTIVKPSDLSRVDKAFFTVNSWVGVILGAALILGALL